MMRPVFDVKQIKFLLLEEWQQHHRGHCQAWTFVWDDGAVIMRRECVPCGAVYMSRRAP